VQHARQLEILHVGEAAVELAGDVEARHRLADGDVVGRRLQRGVVFKLERERHSADQRSDRQLPRTVLRGLGDDNAIADRKR
jgi:hypothetical protein